ncbi:snurportin-1 [Neocloeon triangulifer]|uniref:snurportin-1 n=1 Tax=Neocloeon triangulifer TaxID=2078957 RepID=UPI00286F106A|nr:snurportin-1 [Neocloeon triangulifer]
MLSAAQMPYRLKSEDDQVHRKTLFKIKGTFHSQDEKRKYFLEEQKRKRNAVLDSARVGLLLDTPQKITDDDFILKHLSKKKYGKMLMLSEWMEEVPQDLEEKWLCVPCPIGKRCIVISEKSACYAYSTTGKYLFKNRSLLKEGRVGRTILDCIFSRTNNTIYVLDVLLWADYSLLDCETEFRFYWLTAKFEENMFLVDGGSKENCKFVPLQSVPASSEGIQLILDSKKFPDKLDGVLFFHKESHYTAGVSPLVVWLLPFMVPEVLGLSVDEEFAQQPENYPGHLEYVANYDNMRKELRKQRAAERAARRTPEMDTSECFGQNHKPIEDELELG